MNINREKIKSDLVIDSDFINYGIIDGHITVVHNASLESHGIIGGNVHIEPGCTFSCYGTVNGNIYNAGLLRLFGTLNGQIDNVGDVQIDPNAVINKTKFQ